MKENCINIQSDLMLYTYSQYWSHYKIGHEFLFVFVFLHLNNILVIEYENHMLKYKK